MKLTPLQLANYIEEVGEQYNAIINKRAKKRFITCVKENKEILHSLVDPNIIDPVKIENIIFQRR